MIFLRQVYAQDEPRLDPGIKHTSNIPTLGARSIYLFRSTDEKGKIAATAGTPGHTRAYLQLTRNSSDTSDDIRHLLRTLFFFSLNNDACNDAIIRNFPCPQRFRYPAQCYLQKESMAVP